MHTPTSPKTATLSRRAALGAGLSVTAGLTPGLATALASPGARAAPPRTARLQLQLVRNATLKLTLGSFTLLIDPYLAALHEGKSYGGVQRSPLVPLPMGLDVLLGDVDAVFVSHLHSDHFDDVAQRVLPRDTRLLCPAAIAGPIRTLGFSRVTPIDDTLEHAGLHLRTTPCRHGPDAVLADMGPVHGLLLADRSGPLLYWVGDSVWCPEVAGVIDQHAPPHLVVHACGATWHGQGPLVMDAPQVEAVLRHAPGARVVATHLDCVDHATVSRADLARHFEPLAGLRSRLTVPADGERLTLDA
ncbi:MAG: MBL fold metallo-hydrolase [Rhizobacter sp.]|nr:MBL fold metallo-hydrolase [Rhizobacter sp.]